MLERADKSMAEMEKQGYDKIVIEDFYDLFMKSLKDL